MNKVDLTGCAARQRQVHDAWMSNFKSSLRKNSWRDIVRNNPDRFRIERGFIWEKNALGVWNAISSI